MIKYGILLVLAACYMHTASSCACTKEYKPLCGSDGETYANDCLLRCARARTGRHLTATPGPCRHRREVIRSPCACARNYNPVCASDGNTYANECVLNCAKSKNALLQMSYTGKCQNETPCICTFDYRPVCGSNGQNYSNLCQLNCAKNQDPTLRMVSEGVCRVKREEKRSSCICTLEYSPVRGLDGKQYSNPCMAACAGQLRKD